MVARLAVEADGRQPAVESPGEPLRRNKEVFAVTRVDQGAAVLGVAQVDEYRVEPRHGAR